MSIARFSPALRRAVIKACPRYFSLTPAEQEIFRAQLTDEEELVVEQQLYADLFGISVSTIEESRAAHENLSLVDLNRFNETILPLQGIGDDCFWINDLSGTDSTKNFATLYDFDLDDYEFQEDCRERDFPGHVRKPYRGSLYATWVRLFVDDVFTYGTLFCAAGYLLAEIDDHGSEVIDRLIPHRHVRGENDGKPEKGGFLMDFRIDADGKEGEFEELRDRFWAYQKERQEELCDIWDAQPAGRVWIIDCTKPDDPSATFVFSDKTALCNVRLRHFMADCRRIEGRAEKLEAACAEERARVAAFLEEQHADIEGNFDPKIRKLRKRKKVIMTKGALDDLRNLQE